MIGLEIWCQVLSLCLYDSLHKVKPTRIAGYMYSALDVRGTKQRKLLPGNQSKSIYMSVYIT